MKLKRLFSVLKYISYWNNRGNEEERIENVKRLQIQVFNGEMNRWEIKTATEIQIVKSEVGLIKQKEGSRFKLSKEIVMRMICFSVIIFNIYFIFGLTLIIPGELGIDNIYLNAIMLSLSEVVGYFLISLRAHKTKRKALNLYLCYICVSIGILFLFIRMLGVRRLDFFRIIESLLGVAVKLMNAVSFGLCFNYGAELFPTKIRGASIGLAVFIGRFAGSFVSYLDVFASHIDINPMFFTGVSSLFCIPFILALPETLHKKISN